MQKIILCLLHFTYVQWTIALPHIFALTLIRMARYRHLWTVVNRLVDLSTQLVLRYQRVKAWFKQQIIIYNGCEMVIPLNYLSGCQLLYHPVLLHKSTKRACWFHVELFVKECLYVAFIQNVMKSKSCLSYLLNFQIHPS